MSTKDESIFAKEVLVGTKAGNEIIKQTLLHGKGYKQFSKYKQKAEHEFPEFARRLIVSLHKLITCDNNPSETMTKFVAEVGSPELALDSKRISSIKSRLSNPEVLRDRIQRILNSNFVKMTYPVFNALLDGASEYLKENNISDEVKKSVIDGHIIAIDLSEPMDRIIDKDEDIEFLDDYKLLNPYMLEIARQKISQGGDLILKTFEEGFKDAKTGQDIDLSLKIKPESINYENMNECYKKYRAVMGTAGRNMALNHRLLGDIFYLGMAKAGECVGCGNEIEDAIKNGYIKIPSWPLYFSINTSAKKGFALTIRKSEIYLDEARLALEMLPEDFQLKPFLEFVFLTVSHYNNYWYNEVKRRSLFPNFQNQINTAIKMK
jgi:hypothetical protein